MTSYNDDRPVYWLSATPAVPGQWSACRMRHQQSGLWPLLVTGVEGDREPFGVDAEYNSITTVEQHDCGTVLAEKWHALVEGQSPAGLDYVEPVGRRWPGLTPAPAARQPTDQCADERADEWSDGSLRLALVPAVDGAQALVSLGWTGPLNHDNDTARLAAVVRDWQARFGATVVALGFDTLYLSVAAPPTTLDQALQVTAEHFAFCPDEIWQSETNTFPTYATAILRAQSWSFWWD
jgi:hypothetical protein